MKEAMSMKMSSFLPIAEMQSTASTFFAAYASLAAALMLFRSMFNDLIPEFLRSHVYSLFNYLFTPRSTKATIIIDEQAEISRNLIYDAADVYLGSKIILSSDCFKVHKTLKQKNIFVGVVKNDVIPDTYLNFNLQWTVASVETRDGTGPEKKYFELTFDKKFKEVVVNGYLPYVLVRAKEIKDDEKAVKLYTANYVGRYDYDFDDGCGGVGIWKAINLDHPSTFDTLAMEPQVKSALIEDLERFLRRKDFYKKVGKAWKRGYLLYGPPGTGKSSLVAAMSNYLKFDIYDLELTSLNSNQDLRRILLSTTNRSIVLIEDIDCSVKMQDRQDEHEESSSHTKLTLSGLLNFVDGLWSSCGDERIIVFTTNNKDRLDPALLRPGRMDMHIHMSYCTVEGFKLLTNNYLGVGDHHKLFPEIEGLIGEIEVTPAEIAEELMKCEDVDLALTGVINFLKGKKIEADQKKEVKVSGLEDADDNVSEEKSDSTEHESKMVKKNR